MLEDLMEKAMKHAINLGSQYAEARGQEYLYEFVRADNGTIKEFSRNSRAGIGIRVLYNGRIGFSSTNVLSDESAKRIAELAVSSARATDEIVKLAPREARSGKAVSSYRVLPQEVDEKEKVDIVLEANRAGLEVKGIKSSSTALGAEEDRRIVITSDGSRVESRVIMTGLVQVSVASEGSRLERVHESKSKVSGWEFIKELDWTSFSRDVSNLAAEALKAEPPPAGRMRVIADPELIGLILHEAFGHASEGDLVVTGNSVLYGRVGKQIASPQVTIVDDGRAEGGYYVPFDDEGNEKIPTVIVEKGMLKHFLTGRVEAFKLKMGVTGNSRAQDFSNPPIVRQTNLFMKEGDWDVEEMIKELRNGLYLSGRGAGGGEVNPSAGTFTFSTGPSRIVKNGELGKLVRATVVSGSILDTLKGVEAVGKDLSVRTSVFGGCGKEGQMVRVGHGGPHVLIKEITVGGR